MNQKISKLRSSFHTKICCLCVIYLSSGPVLGESKAFQLPEHSYSGEILKDDINIRSLSLQLSHTDLSLPGNGGLNIDIVRNYNSDLFSGIGWATHSRSFRWAALGPGWSMLVAPRIANNIYVGDGATKISDLCQGKSFETWPYNLGATPDNMLPVLELPGGMTEKIYSDGNYVAVTKSNWKIECISNQLTAKSPQGITYTFGNVSTVKTGQHRLTIEPIRTSSHTYDGNIHDVKYWNATKATDASGNTLTYTYATYGATRPASDLEFYETPAILPKKIQASDGRVVDFTYDSTTGRLTKIVDGAGTTIQYEYLTPDNSNSRTLSKVILPNGTYWQYGYIASAFRDYEYNLNLPSAVSGRRLESVRSPYGGTVNYTWGACGRTNMVLPPYSVRMYESWPIEADNWWTCIKTKKLSNSSSTTTFGWSTSNGYDYTTVTDSQGTTTHKFMGADYKIALDSELVLPFEPYHNNAWQVGQLLEKTYPNGAKETYKWKPRKIANLLIVTWDAGWIYDEDVWTADLEEKVIINGGTYTTKYFDHDQYGNPQRIEEWGPNGGYRNTSVSYYNNTTKWIIGKLKNEAFTGSSVEREFDVNGRLISITKDGLLTFFSYDSQGNISKKILPNGGNYNFANYKRGIPQIETQPEGITIVRSVDNSGNIIQENSGGFPKIYTYDAGTRLKRVAYPNAPAAPPQTFSYTQNTKSTSKAGLTETTEYDPFGRLSSVTLGGIKKSYSYDDFGRKTFESNPGSTLGTSYEYDATNRLTKQINADNSYRLFSYGDGSMTITDERNNSTTYKYKSYGDPSKRFLINIITPIPGASISIQRNAADLITQILQNSKSRTFGYNTYNQLLWENNPEIGLTAYTRDSSGNITSKTTQGWFQTTYAYDKLDRLISAAYPTGEQFNYTYNVQHKMLTATSNDTTKSFKYDAIGNLIEESFVADGQEFITKYGYNFRQQLQTITYPVSGAIVDYTPDILGRPTAVTGMLNNVTYWSSGLIKTIEYANGTTSTYEQNSRLWPSSFSTVKNSGGSYLQNSYQYDSKGNLTSISDAIDSQYNRIIGYDALDQLTSINGPWGNGSITYNNSGDITSWSFGSQYANYNYTFPQNVLLSVQGSKNYNFQYDVIGNVTSDATNTYTYNGVPNLVCVNCNDANRKIQYAYDAVNNRYAVTKNGVKTYEIRDAKNNILVEFTPQTNKLVEYFYLGDKRISQRVTN